MGKSVSWFKTYEAKEVPESSFGGIEYTIAFPEDSEISGTSYGYGRIGRIQKLLQEYTGKELPYDEDYYNVKTKIDETLIEPKELSKMLNKVLKHIEDDNEDKSTISFFKKLADEGFYILLES